MNRARIHVFTIASSLLLSAMPMATRAADDCTTNRCQNPTAIEGVRTTIASQCDCAGASNSVKYMRCVKRVVKAAVAAGTFPSSCKSAVTKCEAALGCGRGLRPFRTVQQIFTESCALPACHSDVRPQSGLVLQSEDVSYKLLVNRPVTLAQGQGPGVVLVKPGIEGRLPDPEARGNGAGPAHAQRREAALQGKDQAHRGLDQARRPPDQRGVLGGRRHHEGQAQQEAVHDRRSARERTSGAAAGARRLRSPRASSASRCTPRSATSTPRRVGTCYAPLGKNIPWGSWRPRGGYDPGQLPVIKAQTYRMHPGSHHLLLYAYFGANPPGLGRDGYFPCNAANCGAENANDCPETRA
jgi:hypothetical protein